MQLHTARDDFFKFANDLAQHTSGSKSTNPGHTIKNPLSDYYLGSVGTCKKFFPQIEIHFTFPYLVGHVLSVPHICPGQPPDGPSC
jgi:hypothetical protein